MTQTYPSFAGYAYAQVPSGEDGVAPLVSRPARMAYLDGWRGLAILMVCAGHFTPQLWPRAAALGGFGVEIFFVLSGRLMAEILFVGRQPLPMFFRRRAARILPGLLFFASAMALVATVQYLGVGTVTMRPLDYVSSITFTYNYVQAFGWAASGLLAHTWSLAVEEHCYMLLALFALAFSRDVRKAKWVLLACGLLAVLNGIAGCVLTGSNVHRIYWRTDVRLASVFLSAAVFLFLRADRALAARVGPWLGRIALPVLAGCAALMLYGRIIIAYPAMALSLPLAINGLDYASPGVKRLFSSRLLTGFGLYSYSLYLWQQPLELIKREAPLHVILPVIAVLALASYYLVERPARRWLNGAPVSWRVAPAAPLPISDAA